MDNEERLLDAALSTLSVFMIILMLLPNSIIY